MNHTRFRLGIVKIRPLSIRPHDLMEESYFFPYDHRVALIFGRESFLNPYKPGADPDALFRASYPTGYSVDIIEGAHGHYFVSPNIETLAEALKRRLAPDDKQQI